ncbi:MAG TPA: short-chain fatty acid transporter, partial [Patescibacteria group bacterium]|nr:short-chain fatty acid transporter [Patescibacteria group bacterium]
MSAGAAGPAPGPAPGPADAARAGVPLLARAGMAIADACERYFPDAFVFALGAVILAFAAGLLLG